MADFLYELRVPKERVAVIIGKHGEMKRLLEREAGVKISIDSEEHVVTLKGDDSLKLYSAREMVKAIARGFNPEVAKLLLRQDYTFEIINISEFANTKGSILRLKGRTIGTDGKARRRIEEETETFIVVYGKTVCVIGELEHAKVAVRAIEKLLQGNMHSTVWKFLDKMRRKLKMDEVLGIEQRRKKKE